MPFRIFKHIKILLLTTILLAAHIQGRASNIQLSDVRLSNRDTINGKVSVVFDLSWDFSWKDRLHLNWDAAWVFAKSYDVYKGEWKHIYWVEPEGSPVQGSAGNFMALPHQMGESNVPMWSEFATSQTDFGEKVSGVFIYRKDVGNGSNMVRDVSLRWNYVDDGYLPTDTLQVAVFAIEMVYIPKNPYIIGDGTSPVSLYADGKNLIIKTDVVSAQSRWMGKITGETGWTYNGTPIPDEFPKGYNSFYVMKYEISQHAYADFLNTLTLEQQTTRTSVLPTAAAGTLAMPPTAYQKNAIQYRNCIRIRSSALPEDGDIPAKSAIYGHSVTGGDADSLWIMEDNGGNIACNFLSWNDGLAYLDWSGLRPMTELEFEKACRGTKFVRREMAWGYQYGISANAKGFNNPFLSSEEAKDPAACYLETGLAPWVMRVGGFAKDSTRRNESGATYYGVMNMSDNLWERCINVSTESGRAFVPRDGDGKLSTQGDAEVYVDLISDDQCWPGAAGGGFRGFQVSNRTYADKTQVNANEGERTPWSGFRGARYAPPATRFEL